MSNIGDFVMPPTGNLVNGNNPLSNYYRVPGLEVKLPTNGAFMPPGTIQFTMSGSLEIFPMAAKDELLLKSPDALMSGAALEKLIRSCVPSILAPRMVATQDLDVLLLAIRAATYGDTMVLDATCPKCDTVNEINCNLPSLLNTMKTVNTDNIVRLQDDLVVYVRPYDLGCATTLALASYEEARKLQAIDDAGTSTGSERSRAIASSMDRINKINLDMLASCIIKIVVPSAEVSDYPAIVDFIANIKKPWTEKIDNKIKEISTGGIDKSISIVCANEKCKHEWKTEVEFNPSNFFDAASSR